MAGEEGLEALRRVGDHEGYLGGLGAQAEEGNFGALAGERHHGAAEVGLGDLPPGRLERHVDLEVFAAQPRDRFAHRDLGPGKAVFAGEAVVDAPRGVALLSRRALVVAEPLADEFEIGSHHR